MSALPETLPDEIVTLRKYRASDVDAVRDAIDASFEELRMWMPWAQTRPTAQSVRDFVQPSILRFGGVADANYAITLTDGGRYVGGCGLMPRVGTRALEIGYWVDTRFTRRGIASASARLLTAAAFALPDIDRVEIRCDAGNIASAGVPRKLGYRLDRIVDYAFETAGNTGRGMIWILNREDWAP
jgi:RimJ/RimL family protein N-acetyltransferase